MRGILFRGKMTDGKWICGNYIYAPGDTFKHSICEPDCPFDWYDIDIETLGQYIGMVDKNGTKIFEGDVLELYCGVHGTYRVNVLDIRRNPFPIDEDKIWEITVIGNIHDNPEMIIEEEM